MLEILPVAGYEGLGNSGRISGKLSNGRRRSTNGKLKRKLKAQTGAGRFKLVLDLCFYEGDDLWSRLRGRKRFLRFTYA